MIQKRKILRYFYRLNEEEQEFILYEMIELYRKQSKDTHIFPRKSLLNTPYILKGKIIYVNFKKNDS